MAAVSRSNQPLDGTSYRVTRVVREDDETTTYEAIDLRDESVVFVEVLLGVVRDDVRRRKTAAAESRIAGSLQAPGIARVLAFDATPEGVPFVVTEPLPGVTLAERLRERSLSPAELVPILVQVCRALASAHSVGVVHGALSPACIHLLAPDPGRFAANDPGEPVFPEVKVTRFGVGHIFGRQGEPLLPGLHLAYAAPERVFGDERHPTQDTYALGCIAYEALSGRTPFHADRRSEIIRGHLAAEPRMLEEAASGFIWPGLAELVMACLAKDPALRVSDLSDLERWLIRVQAEAQDSAQVLHVEREDLSAASTRPTMSGRVGPDVAVASEFPSAAVDPRAASGALWTGSVLAERDGEARGRGWPSWLFGVSALGVVVALGGLAWAVAVAARDEGDPAAVRVRPPVERRPASRPVAEAPAEPDAEKGRPVGPPPENPTPPEPANEAPETPTLPEPANVAHETPTPETPVQALPVPPSEGSAGEAPRPAARVAKAARRVRRPRAETEVEGVTEVPAQDRIENQVVREVAAPDVVVAEPESGTPRSGGGGDVKSAGEPNPEPPHRDPSGSMGDATSGRSS